ncbi:hypothetical protein DLAC_01720 [Tieghemostelium lacteum]|uniref:Transmembrane protein n=1 Tax=Tieghemostelium lacteum TaxID=361077 RepID=A0A152A659_TIELA|nr:hypothetical protein DLAC_01720 [Tieghemostelium lacteum]|eukprot:KYR01712.1 hypothetical protein DLAC_01720 [Tieghemostelium lacteum]
MESDIKYSRLNQSENIQINSDDIRPNNNSTDSTFYDKMQLMVPLFAFHFKLIGIGHKNKWVLRVITVIMILFFVTLFLTSVPYGWLSAVLIYISLLYLFGKVDHLRALQDYLLQSENQQAVSAKEKYTKTSRIYVIVVFWGGTLALVAWTIYEVLTGDNDNYHTSNRVKYGIGMTCQLIGCVLALYSAGCLLGLFHFVCYLHRIEKKYFLSLLENRSAEETPYQKDIEGEGNQPTIDDIFNLYNHKLRISLDTTYRSWRFILFLSVLVLFLYWLFGVYSYFFEDNKYNAPWIIISPAILILFLSPVFLVNESWSNLATQVQSWVKYTVEERIFFITYFSQRPIQFSLFGIVISKPLIASLTFTLLATLASLLAKHVLSLLPNSIINGSSAL